MNNNQTRPVKVSLSKVYKKTDMHRLGGYDGIEIDGRLYVGYFPVSWYAELTNPLNTVKSARYHAKNRNGEWSQVGSITEDVPLEIHLVELERRITSIERSVAAIGNRLEETQQSLKRMKALRPGAHVHRWSAPKTNGHQKDTIRTGQRRCLDCKTWEGEG